MLRKWYVSHLLLLAFFWEENFGVIFAVDISLCALMRCDLPFLFLVVHKGPSFAARCLLHESNKNVK